MTLPASGPISFNNINVELGVSGTTQASLGQASYRTLAGVASGAISMSNFYGKSNSFAFTISTNQTNANLRSLAIAAGWGGSSNVVATINAGVIISSNSNGTPALTINGSFPGGVSLVNNGTIVGMGGNGAGGGNRSSFGANAGSGGTALSVSTATSVTNNGTLAGGGGGGAGGQSKQAANGKTFVFAGGGGGGGGRSSNAANTSGGAGGTGNDSNGVSGTGGSYASAGGGGNGGSAGSAVGGKGGAGGAWGSSGSPESGGSGGSNYNGGSAGSGGAAAASGGLITWVATGTRYGGVS